MKLSGQVLSWDKKKNLYLVNLKTDCHFLDQYFPNAFFFQVDIASRLVPVFRENRAAALNLWQTTRASHAK